MAFDLLIRAQCEKFSALQLLFGNVACNFEAILNFLRKKFSFVTVGLFENFKMDEAA